VTFELPARGATEFYEEIDVIPSVIKGAWFSNDEKTKDLNFRVFDYKNEVVFAQAEARRDIHF
jgi:hypothetical protein